MSAIHSPHGMMRSICVRNSFFFVRTCASSSLSADRLICLSMRIVYHILACFALCGIALIILRIYRANCAIRCLRIVADCLGAAFDRHAGETGAPGQKQQNTHAPAPALAEPVRARVRSVIAFSGDLPEPAALRAAHWPQGRAFFRA